MKVTQITVNAGRTLQHPCETYANIRPEVALTATLNEYDDPIECTRQLQRQAEQLVEEHAIVLKASIAERDVAEREEQELKRLSQSMADSQQRFESLKVNVERRHSGGTGLLFDCTPVSPPST